MKFQIREVNESQPYKRAKLLNFPAFYVLLSYIQICHTQKDKLTAGDQIMICFELPEELSYEPKSTIR